MKWLATVRTLSGSARWAELHWYEGHGAGRKGWKIRRFWTERERVREMLQTLLAERFGLKSHFEDRMIRGYALVVGKPGF
jgi:uncharacterized protein (TIGR03435 family)